MNGKLETLRGNLADIKTITTDFVLVIKNVFLGILATEICTISIVATDAVNHWIDLRNYEISSFYISGVCIAILISYFFTRGIFKEFLKIAKSARFDVLIAISFGIWIYTVWNNLIPEWHTDFIRSLNAIQVLSIISFPFLAFILVTARTLFSRENKNDSSFVVDEEIKERKDDLLNFADRADSFAERVFNNGSPESFVFGIDSPWGIGKSTFVNFCKQYWREKNDDKTIVYEFSPLKHSGATNLLEIFIDGLIHAIQKDSFVPEIKPLIFRYSRLLKEVRRFSIFGLLAPSLTSDYTSEEACDDLEVILKHFPKKIIVVVDDLDRINLSEIKQILFVIRKSFNFPNISYVICYDTENISLMETENHDADKISRFLEKFVNIKISLYIDRKDLAEYVSENLGRTITNSFVDPLPVRQAIGGLLDIYKSEKIYHEYLPFIGDVRKLKRLINTVLLFDLQSTDFRNSDFDKRDLVNLLLIYIHYPSVFRKIYDTETNGGRGFFSLVLPHEDGYEREAHERSNSFSDSTYKNSTYYKKYLNRLGENSPERFLLEQVFSVEVRLKSLEENTHYDNSYARIDSVPEDFRTSLACFNGGWTNGRNLETYLNLIVNLSKPIDVGQHRFYTTWRDKIIDGTETLDSAFSDDRFAYKHGEYTRERLWRILVNNARTLKGDLANKIISYLLDTVPEYSLFELGEENNGTGLRHNLDYFLTRLLNDSGWSDRAGKHSNNTPENITEIAEWVFGDGRHAGNGVIEKLSEASRGVLGFHDLMLFRLSCSADRGGDIFDLSRAIAQHANKDAPTQGDTRNIAKEEMREISQKIFAIFNSRYILTKKNIFEEINLLETKDFAGKYSEYITEKITDGTFGVEQIEKKTNELKTRIGSFIIYQLANREISHGVGCGVYNPTGVDDKNIISDLINEYLFEVCFDPADPKNAEYFIDYLFRNLANTFASEREDEQKYTPTIEEFTKVLHKEKLSVFWQKNNETFKNLKLEEKDKTVSMGKDDASYKKYIPMIYKVLDDNLPKQEKVLEVDSLVIPGVDSLKVEK